MPRLRCQQSGPPPDLVAARIRQERERLGLSGAEAARRAGVTRQTYAQYERASSGAIPVLLALRRAGFDLGRIAPELFETRTATR